MRCWMLFAMFVGVLSAGVSHAAEPKKLLVVTTTAGFRHDSIPIAEKTLTELAEKSGAFTVDFVRQPEGQPRAPRRPANLTESATDEQKQAYAAAMERYNAAVAANAEADAKWNAALAEALKKLAPESLAGYDGIVFANTTGDLPIPDKEGFLNWLKSGKAFVGIHSASDTFHGWPEFIDMIGGEFDRHGAQVGVECHCEETSHPSTVHLPAKWTIAQEEIYLFKSYDPAKVKELLVLDKHPNDKTPGRFPLTWTRDFGKGRIFYTALGHRQDLYSPDPQIPDRKNPPETADAFRAHILGGILWALNTAPANKQ